MKAIRRMFAVLTTAAAFVANGNCQILVYNQPSTATMDGYGGEASGGIWTATFDDFVLPFSAGITTVSWAGFLSHDFGDGLDNGYISSFTVSFCADNAGEPGTLLYSANILGNADETLSTQNAYATYLYSANLPSEFSALGGQKYWISVEPFFTDTSPVGYPPGNYWYWMFGSGGDNLSYLSGYESGNDLTFALFAVPEPAPFPLLLLGGLVLVCRRQR